MPTNTIKNSDNEEKEQDTDTPGQQTSANGIISVEASAEQWCSATYLTLFREEPLGSHLHLPMPQPSTACRSHQHIASHAPRYYSCLGAAKAVERMTFISKVGWRCCLLPIPLLALYKVLWVETSARHTAKG